MRWLWHEKQIIALEQIYRAIRYSRWQIKIIEQALKTHRVLLLSGPRQCGKTTLAKQVAGSYTTYLTLGTCTE